MEQFLRIGVITTTHGLAGEVKVFPTTDTPARFKTVKDVIIKAPKGDIETKVTGVRFFKNLVILKFAAFNDIEEVKSLAGSDIMIDRKYGAPLKPGEYYIADLLDCEVITDEGKPLGTVKDVLQTGANDVYIVNTPEGKEILLPVIPECIKNVDIEKSVITVHIMKGLLD